MYSYSKNISAFFFCDYFKETADDFTAAMVGTQTKGEVFLKTEFFFLKIWSFYGRLHSVTTAGTLLVHFPSLFGKKKKKETQEK